MLRAVNVIVVFVLCTYMGKILRFHQKHFFLGLLN